MHEACQYYTGERYRFTRRGCSTCLPVPVSAVAVLIVPVHVSVLVRQGHVFQAVVLGSHLRVGRVGQAVGGVRGEAVGRRVSGESRAGAEALTRADGARSLRQVLRVQSVPVRAVFGPAGDKTVAG